MERAARRQKKKRAAKQRKERKMRKNLEKVAGISKAQWLSGHRKEANDALRYVPRQRKERKT